MVSPNKRKSNNAWDAKNMTVLGCKVRKDEAAAFKDACGQAGTTVNAVFRRAMEDFMADGATKK